MAKNTDVRVYIIVGEDGNYAVAKERTELVEVYAREFGGVPPSTRTIAIALGVARPRDVRVGGIVEDGQTEVAVEVG